MYYTQNAEQDIKNRCSFCCVNSYALIIIPSTQLHPNGAVFFFIFYLVPDNLHTNNMLLVKGFNNFTFTIIFLVWEYTRKFVVFSRCLRDVYQIISQILLLKRKWILTWRWVNIDFKAGVILLFYYFSLLINRSDNIWYGQLEYVTIWYAKVNFFILMG